MNDPCPVYISLALFQRLRDRADASHTTVNFLVIQIISDALGPPEDPRRHRPGD